MLDQYHRKIDYLRISVTDRCNLRCIYCMPPEGVPSLAQEEILTFEEIVRVCKIGTQLGIRKIKITGGEPLVRKDVVKLIAQIKAIPLIEQLTLTTNGVLLEESLDDLKSAGLDGVNISLDSLNREKFLAITGSDCLDQLLRGLEKALALGIPSVKLNCLSAEEWSREEILNLAKIAQDHAVSVRFIELMPIGLGRKYHPIPNSEILKILGQAYGSLKFVQEALGNGPAVYYQPKGFQGAIGLISAVSNEFCSDCNRIRLTADGFLKLCLHYNEGIDLKTLLRSNISDSVLQEKITEAIYHKPRHHMFGKSSDLSKLEGKIMSQIGG